MKYITICITSIFLFYLNILSAQNTNNSPTNDSVFVFHSKQKNMVSMSSSGYLTEDSFFEIYGIKYGKFISNRVSAGAEIARSHFGEWERTTYFGLNARYYYAVLKHFAYFTEAKYLLGYRNYNNELTASEWNGRTNSFSTNLGIVFNGFYKKRFGLEFFTGFCYNTLYTENHETLGEYYWSKSDFIYGFQLNYYF